MILRSAQSFAKRQQSVYVLEVNGVPTLAFMAASNKEAKELLKVAWLMENLRSMQSAGRALWDGKALLRIEPAVGEQVEEIRRKLGEMSGAEGLPMVHLVKVDT